MIQLSQEEILKISQLCQSNKVRSLHAFGSVTREDFNPNSDIVRMYYSLMFYHYA